MVVPPAAENATTGRAGALPGGLRALVALLAEQPDPDALAVLRAAAETWLRAGGTISFDRLLRLPNARQLRRQTRDFAIDQCLRLVGGANEHQRAVQLHKLLRDMAARDTWHRWREQGGAPAAADELHKRAFEVLSNGRDPAVPSVPALTPLRQRAAKISL